MTSSTSSTELVVRPDLQGYPSGVDTADPPRVSLIVATVERTDTLAALLTSLSASQPVDFEVIVVDQNPDGRLTPRLAHFQPTLSLQHIQTPVRGANRARNLGAQYARYEWLGFADDDCRYRPDTLKIAQELIATQGPVAVSGVFDDDGPGPRPEWARRPRHYRRASLPDVCESVLFVQRAAFLAVGGFDEEFGPGAPFPGSEGADLVIRLLDAFPHATADLSLQLRIWHPIKGPPWDAPAADRLYNLGFGSGALVAKHPHFTYRVRFLSRWTRAMLTAVSSADAGKREAYRRWGVGFTHGWTEYRRRRAARPEG
ncbi:MAG: glycosyltransferase family 2 protein [Anaerolineae bacterium]|nr:glycosyltransferase family 2 protein [Anaerolineae bacterium]